MFKAHCKDKGLAGTPEDFAVWSENLLKNPDVAMDSVRDVSKTKKERQNMRNRERYREDESSVAAPPPMKQNATLTLDFAGKKKSFSSDDDEGSDEED